MFCDVSLAFDPFVRRFDMVFDGSDLVLDFTPATPLLISIGTDRRAHTDDVLPDRDAPFLTPVSLVARRGYPGDCLDRRGRLIGSRVWVFLFGKQTETTRRGLASAAAEACAWFETQLGLAVQVSVTWLRAGVAGLVVRVGGTELQLDRFLAQ